MAAEGTEMENSAVLAVCKGGDGGVEADCVEASECRRAESRNLAEPDRKEDLFCVLGDLWRGKCAEWRAIDGTDRDDGTTSVRRSCKDVER